MRKHWMAVVAVITVVAGLGLNSVGVSAGPIAVDVTIVGKNIAVVPALAKDQSANAVPVLAEMNVLKVSSVKGADGKALAGLKDTYLYYLPVKAAQSLFVGKANANKEFEITGKLFKAESALLVTSFKEIFEDITIGGVTGKPKEL